MNHPAPQRIDPSIVFKHEHPPHADPYTRMSLLALLTDMMTMRDRQHPPSADILQLIEKLTSIIERHEPSV